MSLNLFSGYYSCLFASFYITRNYNFYILFNYVPSIMVVLLSWVSFWLDPLAVPGRTSLGVLTVLTMTTTMTSGSSTSLPKVSYTKALDIWNTGCMCFLFAALIEFAIVNTLARYEVATSDSVVTNRMKSEEPNLKVP